MDRSTSVFALVALAQLAVPAWMIVSHERILREGEVFKFRTAPIDPRDPFRGEYVMLNFEAESGQWVDPFQSEATEDKTAFAMLATNGEGYAQIVDLTAEKPDSGAYLTVTYWAMNDDSVSRVSLPFDRYYMEEGDGQKTEEMLAPQWDADTLTQPLPAYAQVRIKNGEAVIEDLIIGDRSIHDWLKEMPANTP